MFDWDERNHEHVLRRGVHPREAEEAILDPRRIGSSAHNVGGQHRWALLGASEDGRVLFVVYVWRADRIRIVTARDATDRERRRYRRRGK